MILSIARPGRAKSPLFSVHAPGGVRDAKDAIRLVLAAVPKAGKPTRKVKEKDVPYLARLLSIKSKERK